MSAPILAMPQDDAPYTLDTDASDTHLGAVLSQLQEGKERVIAYSSRVLDKAEANYSAVRRELLALIFGLRKYKQYLLGREFTIRKTTQHYSTCVGPQSSLDKRLDGLTTLNNSSSILSIERVPLMETRTVCHACRPRTRQRALRTTSSHQPPKTLSRATRLTSVSHPSYGPHQQASQVLNVLTIQT